MHFKRIENIFKLKKIAWAENYCLPWMLPCNPLGAWVISHRVIERETAISFAKMRGEEEEQEILLTNSVNVLLPCTIDRPRGRVCFCRAGGSEPMEHPAVVYLLPAGEGCREPTRPTTIHPVSCCLSGLRALEEDISVLSGNPAQLQPTQPLPPPCYGEPAISSSLRQYSNTNK